MVGIEPTWNAGEADDAVSTPGSGRAPGGRAWQPTPVSWPGESMDRGAWWPTVPGVTKSRTQLKRLGMRACTHMYTVSLFHPSVVTDVELFPVIYSSLYFQV